MVSTMVGFDVQVVDGAGLPVPSIEVGARYRYPTAPRTWSAEMTDGDGCARFEDDHSEPPTEVCLFVADEDCGTHALTPGACYVLEM